MSIERLLTEDANVRRYVVANPSVRRFVAELDPGAERCLKAMSGAPGATIDDVCSCYSDDPEPEDDECDEEAQEAQWRTYAAHLGLPVDNDEAREYAELPEEERTWLRYCAQVDLRP